MKTRREFLQTMGTAGVAGLLAGMSSCANGSAKRAVFQPIKFGIISDIHRDMTPDADERLEVFMKKVDEERPDFLISLGDFAHAISANEGFAKRFASSKAPAYHALGNHEMDLVDKKDATAFLGMPSPYYSFDIGGYHCVVFDPNFIYFDDQFIGYEKGNYFNYGSNVSYVNDDQCDWLENDLRNTNLPVFLFSHQSLLHDTGIPNRAYVQRILERENERCGFQKVLGCFNGHHHLDFYRMMSGIHYFSINSASYVWHDGGMALFQDPLFCFVTIDSSGKLFLRGAISDWAVPPLANPASKSVRYGSEITTIISDYDVTLNPPMI